MKVKCTIEDSAEGLDELVRVLTYYRDHRPDTKVEIYSRTNSDFYNIFVKWTEDR